MAVIKIVCITRDERELIEDWLLYHGYIVGYENIILLDNNSVDPEVLRVYDEYVKKGITIHKIESIQGNRLGDHPTNFMNMYKSQCEWIFAIDTDEFLFSSKHLREGGDPTNRENILETLRSIPDDQTWCLIDMFPQSEVDVSSPHYIDHTMIKPARNMIYFSKDAAKSKTTHWYDDCKKSFFRSNAFVKISMGNHVGEVTHGTTGRAPLGYFHFHSTGSKDIYERARKIIDSQKYVNINDKLENIMNGMVSAAGSGHHRIWQYSNYIARMYIVETTIKYLKRLPTLEELDNYAEKTRRQPAEFTVNLIKGLDEAHSNLETLIPEFCQKEIDSIVFYEPPLDSENTVSFKWLAERFKSL